MATVIVFANQKGGVGKTTSTYNLGVALADIGQKVLLLDLDPQGGLTYYAGFEPEDLGKTIYHCLVRNMPPREILVTNEYGVDVLPANIDLSLAEFQLVNAPARERRITRIVNEVRDQYDFVLIDSQPSLGLLTINALAAADEVIIPVSCEFLSLRGTRALLKLIAKVKGSLNSRLQIAGLLPTMFDTRTLHGREILALLHTEFPQLSVFPHTVARSIRFAESTKARAPVFAAKIQVPGALAYRELARDLVKNQRIYA
ncbi:MAG: AAA family ATPase [Bacillota bacterium]|nr:AAA family ATPase [Bacillota bacterium]HHT90442.1 ParA family protein [Bacillota bacterium]